MWQAHDSFPLLIWSKVQNIKLQSGKICLDFELFIEMIASKIELQNVGGLIVR